MASLLNDIADAAIIAAASAAVTGLAGSTGVGLPLALVLGAVTMTQIYRTVRGVLRLIDIIAVSRAAIDLHQSALASFGLLASGVSLPRLPIA